MRRVNAFIHRNFLEILRDPVIYVFCIGFPVVMLLLFFVIHSFTADNTPVFSMPSLVPGIIVFSLSFLMLTLALLVSKDHASAFLTRLYISPMKSWEFVLGYLIPALLVGALQIFVCLLFGAGLSLFGEDGYFTFARAILCGVQALPTLFFFAFMGIGIGTAFSEKAAPAICSVLISAAGVLSGAWMPLDAMGAFETVCQILPFYPAVILGRITTGALHSYPDQTGLALLPYTFDKDAWFAILAVALWLFAAMAFATLAFLRKRRAK